LHLAGPLSYDVFRNVNSLQLHAPYDQSERNRARQRSFSHREGRGEEKFATRLRHLMNVLVGVAVGIVAVLMRLGYQSITRTRLEVVLHLLGQAGNASGGAATWLVAKTALTAAALTAGLALPASVLVFWRPAAASSGIPGVIAYLNGVDLNPALGGPVLLAKALGTILAVGAGLAVGPEGPMIHIGATVGRLVVHGCMRPALRHMGPKGRRLEDELARHPLRYDVQAAAMGAGAGIAAAFQAPLAGTLFVVEEAASFFSKRLCFHTFITCTSALITTLLLDAMMAAEHHSFYSRTPDCAKAQAWSGVLFAEVAMVGILCGLLGTVFNRAVVCIATRSALQARRLGHSWPLARRRFALVVVIGALCGAFAVCLPATRPCMDASLQNAFSGSSGCIAEEWLQQLMAGSRSVPTQQVHSGFRHETEGPLAVGYIPAPGLFGAQFNPVQCPEAVKRTQGKCAIPGVEAHLDRDAGQKAEHYCCGFSDLKSLDSGVYFSFAKPLAPLNMSREHWPRGSCTAGRHDADNGVWIEQYSPAAALSLTQPSVVVRNLLMRGAPRLLPASDLCLFLVGYGALTVLSTGAWVPGGLLVPMMAIGAATGRLCGLAWDACFRLASASKHQPLVSWIPELKPVLELVFPGAVTGSPGWPPEPGVLALAGCAAFLSGSGALALFVIVLLVEITFEPALLPVVIIAVLAARGTASLLLSKGLYHQLINVQSLPFLHEHHHWRQEHYVVGDILEEDARTALILTGHQLDWTMLDNLEATSGGDGGSLAEASSFAAAPVGAVVSPAHLRSLVISVSKHAGRAEVETALAKCLPGCTVPTVRGFPVVEEGGQLCGLVAREALEGLLHEDELGAGPFVGDPDPRSAAAFPGGIPLARQAQATGRRLAMREDATTPLGVNRVMDTAPFVVQPSTPVLHAHMLFSRCGLRHVVVVDTCHRPIGVLTRKSLMPWRTPWPRHEGASLISEDTFVETRVAHSPTGTPPGSPSLTHTRRAW